MANANEQFRALYEKYFSAVVSFLVRFGFERQDALDLAQETFIRVFEHMDSWLGSEWMFLRTTASRIALNEIRRRRTLKHGLAPLALEDDSITEPASSDPPPDVELLERENVERRISAYQAALAKLAPRVQGPLLLRLGGASYKQIAQTLSLNVNVVKTRLHEAKIELRKSVNAAPEEVDDHDDE